MADNYLEKQYEEYLKTKLLGGEARKLRWRKQMKTQLDLQKSKSDTKTK